MDDKTLVEAKISDSTLLIQQLDSQGDPPAVALWYFYEDAADWILLLGGPSFDRLLPSQEALAYRKIAEALVAINIVSLSISDIKLNKTDTPLFNALSFLIGTERNGVVRAHFTDTVVNGIFIKEMIILRSSR